MKDLPLEEDKKKFIDKIINEIESVANLGNIEEKIYFINELWNLIIKDMEDLKDITDKISEIERKREG